MLRSENDVIPADAMMVAVPERVPLPGLLEIAKTTFPVNVVLVLP